MNGMQMPNNLARHAVNGAAATVLWQSIRMFLQFASIIVLARLLTPSDYGLLAMALAIIGVGELLRDMGLSMASVQAKDVTHLEKSNLFWTNAIIGGVLTVGAYIAAEPIAMFYDRHELVQIVHVLSFTFLINGVATQFKAQIHRDLRFMILGVVETLPQLFGLVAAIGYAVYEGGYGALVLQAIVVGASALILDVCFARWWPSGISRKTSIRRFLRFGGALAGTQALAYASKNLDTVLLGVSVPAGGLGYYNRAYQIVNLPLSQLTAPITRVAIPILSRMDGGSARFVEFLRTGQFFGVGTATFIFGVAIGLAGPLTELFLGDAWAPVAPILQVLAISGIFRILGQVPYWIFVSQGLAVKQFRFYLVAQPLVVAGIVAGLPYGVMGVATGIAVGYAVFWLAHMFWAGRVTGTRTAGLLMSGLLLVLAVMIPVVAIGAISDSMFSDPVVAVCLGLLGALIYVMGLLTLVPSYRREVEVVVRILRKK